LLQKSVDFVECAKALFLNLVTIVQGKGTKLQTSCKFVQHVFNVDMHVSCPGLHFCTSLIEIVVLDGCGCLLNINTNLYACLD
jgi:hypothetical protein